MKGKRFTKWMRPLPLLSRRRRGALLEALRPALGLDRQREAIKGTAGPRPGCPACHAERCYRHGRDRGLQRYRCRACGKTFTALSGTPLSRLRHRGKWLDYLDQMLKTRSVRAAAKARTAPFMPFACAASPPEPASLARLQCFLSRSSGHFLFIVMFMQQKFLAEKKDILFA